MDDITRMLPVVLSQDEFDQRAAELAAVNQEIEALVLERKAATTEFKGKIEDAQGRQSRLTTIVAKRAEVREVGCEQRINPEAKLVEVIRMDTGEIVDTRGITAKDIQEALDFLPRDAEPDSDHK